MVTAGRSPSPTRFVFAGGHGMSQAIIATQAHATATPLHDLDAVGRKDRPERQSAPDAPDGVRGGMFYLYRRMAESERAPLRNFSRVFDRRPAGPRGRPRRGCPSNPLSHRRPGLLCPARGHKSEWCRLPNRPSKPTEAKPKRPPGRPKEINKGQAHTPPTPPTDGAQQAPVGGGCLLRVQPAEGLTQ